MTTSGQTETAVCKTDNEQEAETTLASESELREDLIATAVKFLQNPKVRQSPFDKRRAFLEKKGLSKAEIDLAVYRSGTGADEHNANSAVSSVVAVGNNTYEASPVVPAVVVAPPSGLSRLKEVLNWAVIIGGASYAVVQLYYKFLAPAFTSRRTSGRNDPLVDLNRNVDELRRGVTEVFTSITETQQLMKNQQRMLDDVVRATGLQRGPEEIARMSLVDVKDEIKSLKALLLNKNQFPAVPVTAPVIPSWQLQSEKTTSKSNTEASSVAADDSSLPVSVSEAHEVTSVQQLKTDDDVAVENASVPDTVISADGVSDVSDDGKVIESTSVATVN